jgi:hypothetical protein
LKAIFSLEETKAAVDAIIKIRKNKQMIKVAISGKSGTGKDTVAKLLEQEFKELHLTCKSIAFANPIKEMAMIMFPQIKRSWLYGSSSLRDTIISGANDSNGKPLTCRRLLLDLGTSVGRSYNDNIWLDNLSTLINKKLKNYDVIIVMDARFENEINFLKKEGFSCVRVLRNTEYKVNHPSDINQDNIDNSFFDCIIENNQDMKALKLLTKQYFNKLLNH